MGKKIHMSRLDMNIKNTILVIFEFSILRGKPLNFEKFGFLYETQILNFAFLDYFFIKVLIAVVILYIFK